MKNYMILTCSRHSDVVDLNIYPSLSDGEIHKALRNLGCPRELWLGIHSNPKDMAGMTAMLNEVNESHFGGYMDNTIDAFRNGQRDQGLDLPEQLHSLLAFPNTSDREDAMDQYIEKQDNYCRQFVDNPASGRLRYGIQFKPSTG